MNTKERIEQKIKSKEKESTFLSVAIMMLLTSSFSLIFFIPIGIFTNVNLLFLAVLSVIFGYSLYYLFSKILKHLKSDHQYILFEEFDNKNETFGKYKRIDEFAVKIIEDLGDKYKVRTDTHRFGKRDVVVDKWKVTKMNYFKIIK